MEQEQLSVYLRQRDVAALNHIRRHTGIKSKAEAIRVALAAYATERGWEPPADPATPEQIAEWDAVLP